MMNVVVGNYCIYLVEYNDDESCDFKLLVKYNDEKCCDCQVLYLFS